MSGEHRNEAGGVHPAARLVGTLAVVLVVAGGTWWASGGRAGQWLLDSERQLEAWCERRLWLAAILATVLYAVVTCFSIPVATLMSLALGRLLGFLPALFVVSFGSSIGATGALLLARALLGDSVRRRLGDRGERLLVRFERDGAFFLFTLRMMPQVPFVLVNLAMSVSRIRVRTFYLVSQAGMLPATSIYVFTGSRLPSLATVAHGEVADILTWPLISGLIALGLFPLLARMAWSGRGNGESSKSKAD